MLDLDSTLLLKLAQSEVDTLPRTQDGSVGYDANKSRVAFQPNAFTLGGHVD
ncbi:hypothetical protein [Mycobacterium paraense]|uniref:hypothetical protein n=1 Tax=Mycobacterium paraense TaxID=767916 RepID=UPI001483744F|nr:hypothetical protein [Mycobacterium paraense]